MPLCCKVLLAAVIASIGGALLSACAGAGAAPAESALAEHETLHGGPLDGCEAWPTAEAGGVLIECPQRGMHLRIEPFAVDVRTVRAEIISGWSEIEVVEPIAELVAEDQVVVRFSESPGLMAIAEAEHGSFMSVCGQQPGERVPFDEAWCRDAMRVVLEEGPRSFLPPTASIDFAGRRIELGTAAGCWAERPGVVSCGDGAQLSWRTESSDHVDARADAQAAYALAMLLNRGARRLDEQMPRCQVDENDASSCHVVRLASGKDVLISVVAAAAVRDRHVVVECSYAVDDAGPRLDPWLPPVCAKVLSVEP